MKSHACFRVSVDVVAKDFAKYADLARTRTFEIWDEGNVDVLLVRIDAVRDWHLQLQVSTPSALMTNEERASLEASMPTDEELRTNRWSDERPTLPDC
jgi:hypothetical protein